ncbi:ABC transporter ATP-binding protein [Streptomyces sp. NPDC002838]|uniref:ABC transporter ATP-binding protein n=1 Tax=Streptomyces sp. NPDC002838 TaxID=3154436 RepID=UPI0033201523
MVDSMVAGDELAALVWPAAGFAAAMLVRQAGEIFSVAIRAVASKRIDGHVRSEVRRIALRGETIRHLEDPGFHDVATRAGDQGLTWRVRSPGTAAVGQAEVTTRILAALSMAVVLAAYFPLLAVSCLVLSLVVRWMIRRQWMYLESVKDAATPERRKVDFWADLGASPKAALEVRLFGLAGWVSERRLAAHYAWMADYWKIRRKVLRSQKTAAVLAGLSAGPALLVPGLAAVDGDITTGELTSCLVAAWGIFAIANMGPEAFDIEYGKTAVSALGTLRRMSPERRAGPRAAPPVAPVVRFERVSFTYPGAERAVLEDLDLTIRPGERLGVVGVSGAGKTTLTKLLAGLYEPTCGQITVDGVDLRTFEADAWRRGMTALFQDFVRYPLSARDNVTLSAPGDPGRDDEIAKLAQAAGAQAVLDNLESGLDTVLWRTGSDGRDLSGGQWQKLAILRALYAVARGRRLVVLDEPTAHVDVRAEAEFYEKVIGSVGDASVVLISHRLSTVRHADRVVLLKDGHIAEEGTHAELLSVNGEYARLFRLQASRFQQGEATEGHA